MPRIVAECLLSQKHLLATLRDDAKGRLKNGIHPATALGKLGGPDAIDALLRAAKTGSETVRLSALSGLESLITGGYVALTEYPEVVTIESAEIREVYVYLSD